MSGCLFSSGDGDGPAPGAKYLRSAVRIVYRRADRDASRDVAELAGFTRRECHSCSDAREWFNRPLADTLRF